MRSVFIFIAVTLTPGQSFVTVTQCGADSTGKVDSTGAFNTCFKSVPAGDVVVPPGIYKIAGTIVKNRDQDLVGSGAKASTLRCESVSAPCLVVADVTGGANNYSGSRIQDLTLQGPGVDNTSVGVYLGGDPSGRISPSNAFADIANLVDVRITGFNRGVEWGNNAYFNKVVRTLVFGNAIGLYVPAGVRNSGESVSLTDSAIFNNSKFGLDDHGNFEWMLSGTSFDYNATAIEFFGATIHAVNCHFEQSKAQVFFQPYGSANLGLRDSEILIQASSGSENEILNTWPQSLNLAIDNLSIWANHPVQYFLRNRGLLSGSINNLHGNGNKLVHALADLPITSLPVTANSAF